MSSLGLSLEELKAVEQTRQRLAQLSASLNSLKNDVFHSTPLPNVDSLEASADILNHNVRAILDTISQNNDLFSRVAVHPSTNFPGRTQENILLQLLRKKPEPDVEAAMEEGSKTLASMPLPGRLQVATTDVGDKEKEGALENIWGTVRGALQERIAEYVMNEEGDSFTAEEHEMGIENVRTGLQRSFDDEYEDEDDEEEMDVDEVNGVPTQTQGNTADADLMIIDRPPPPPAPAVSTQEVEGATPESILRLATRGQLTV
ncbi:mediator of RNA polymerase II transcription complex subunit 8-domain-containing protein [Nemania sp. NC0429]|nr:mediator of RNA polymerase II transcription complex subunit 8-domain-containing protein [Nemania sp. NC0429]